MRLDKLPPDRLDPAQRALYDEIAGGPRSSNSPFAMLDEQGALEGPFNAMLYSPQLGQALQQLGATIRYQGTLSDRARELAILAVAAHWDSDFERYAHEAVGRRIGLTEDELRILREGGEPELADEAERTVLSVTFQLLRTSDLGEEVYAAARGVLGDSGLVELTTLVGYYATLALQLRVFRVESPS